MTKDAIKLAVKAYNAQIEHCNETIRDIVKMREEVQDKCPHDEKVTEELYEWAPGHMHTVNVCSICGKILPSNITGNFTITTN